MHLALTVASRSRGCKKRMGQDGPPSGTTGLRELARGLRPRHGRLADLLDRQPAVDLGLVLREPGRALLGRRIAPERFEPRTQRRSERVQMPLDLLARHAGTSNRFVCADFPSVEPAGK